MDRVFLDFASSSAPRLSSEHFNEVASTKRDIVPRSYGGVLMPDDDTLATRGDGRGLRIYDELQRDGHAYAVIQKRKMAVISREWAVEPASDSPDDRKAAELVRSQLENLGLDRMTLDLLDAIPKGFAITEVMWRREGDQIVAHSTIPRAQTRFVFDEERQLRLLTPNAMIAGEELPDRKFIRHTFGAIDANPYGLGLGSKLFWYVYFKRQVTASWLIFADKFAAPTAIGEYPPGTSQAEQIRLLNAAESLSQEAAVVIPQGMVLRLLEAARTGSVEAYAQFLSYCDQMIAETVLGETLTTSVGDSGSRALGDVHNSVRLELVKADSDLLSDTLNATIVRWIVELNMPGATPPKLYRIFSEPEDLKLRAERDEIVCGMGFKPTLDYVIEIYGEGWELSAPPPAVSVAPPVGAPAPAPAFAEPGAQDVADAFADQVGERMPAVMNDLLAPVRRLVADASSLDEVRAGLLGTFDAMEVGAFAGLMQQALTAAELAGRYEAADGR